MFKTINGFTKAKMINVIKNRIKDEPCVDQTGSCAYEDGKGNHCAVGAFIPDKHEAMSSTRTVLSMLDTYPILKEYMPLSTDGLVKLQLVHDACVHSGEMPVPLLIKWIEENVIDG